VTERRSGSCFSEERMSERRSGTFFFPGIGITTTSPSQTEFWVALCVPEPLFVKKIELIATHISSSIHHFLRVYFIHYFIPSIDALSCQNSVVNCTKITHLL
jgi:hypothetical protein